MYIVLLYYKQSQLKELGIFLCPFVLFLVHLQVQQVPIHQ